MGHWLLLPILLTHSMPGLAFAPCRTLYLVLWVWQLWTPVTGPTGGTMTTVTSQQTGRWHTGLTIIRGLSGCGRWGSSSGLSLRLGGFLGIKNIRKQQTQLGLSWPDIIATYVHLIG